MKPICLVLGAGAGIGGSVAKRFAQGGYHVVLCRRSDQAGLDKLLQSIREAGGEASGRIMNAINPDTIEQCIKEIETNTGPIEVVVYNLGAQNGFKSLDETSYKEFERGWQLGTFGLFRLAKTLCPLMERRGKGTILVTSATAAMRGNGNQHAHTAAMSGRRMLCQSLNAEYAGKGIHVAHIIIDGSVDAPDTLGKLIGPELFAQLRDAKGGEHDGLVLPEQVAESYYHLAHQHRSAWTFEMDIRAHSDSAWWNH